MAALNSVPRKLLITLTICITCGASMQVIDNHSLEDQVDAYYLEHEVSQRDAAKAARSIEIDEDTIAGCKPCSQDQLKYCYGDGLLSDHCCCDKRYEETLPFIPHSCYLSARPCTLHAANCGEYHRLRRCCCDTPLRKKWKARSRSNSKSLSTLLCIVSTAAFILL